MLSTTILSVMKKNYGANRGSNATIISQASQRMRRLSVRSTYVLVFLVAASSAFFALRVPRGVKGLSERRQQIEQLEKRNALLEQEIERKREHVRRLSSNPGEQELEIRQRLKLVHPGDKVYILSK